MSKSIWQGAVAVIVGLVLLSLAGRAPAGFENSCCVCSCQGSTFCGQTAPSDCFLFCANGAINASACAPNFVNSSSCDALVACAGTTLPAPALDPVGAAAAALLLGGLGVFGLRRLRRPRHDA